MQIISVNRCASMRRTAPGSVSRIFTRPCVYDNRSGLNIERALNAPAPLPRWGHRGGARHAATAALTACVMRRWPQGRFSRTTSTMPAIRALTASGRSGQASMTAARSGSVVLVCCARLLGLVLVVGSVVLQVCAASPLADGGSGLLIRRSGVRILPGALAAGMTAYRTVRGRECDSYDRPKISCRGPSIVRRSRVSLSNSVSTSLRPSSRASSESGWCMSRAMNW